MNTINKVLCYGMACLALASTSALAATDGVWSAASGNSSGDYELSFTVNEHIVINGFADGAFTSDFNTETVNTPLCVWTNASDGADYTGFDTTVTMTNGGAGTTPLLVGTDASTIELDMTLTTFTPGNAVAPTATNASISMGSAYAASDDVNFGATYAAAGAGPTCAAANRTMNIASELTDTQKAASNAGIDYSNTFTVQVTLT